MLDHSKNRAYDFFWKFWYQTKAKALLISNLSKISAMSTGSTFYYVIKISGIRNSEDLLPILVPNKSLFSAVYDLFFLIGENLFLKAVPIAG